MTLQVETTASRSATTQAVAPDVSLDVLAREARDRVHRGRLKHQPRLFFGLMAALVLGGSIGSGLGWRQGAAFDWRTTVLFVVLYAVVTRIEFEIGTGAAVPTELLLVPMLFELPLGLVPAVVVLGLVLGSFVTRSKAFTVDRLLVVIASAAMSFGPVTVLALAGGLPLRWGSWPLYLAALGAQFAFDYTAAAVTSGLGHRVPLRRLTGHLGWVFVVDACLAPVGFVFALATRPHVALVVLILPLVLLLRHFSHERRRRIDHALELSDAYRGTAFLLGDVVEADDSYTGAHSRHVVDLVMAVCDELGLDANERRDAEFVALLHDVGKIRIPAEIINKPGPLTPAERVVIETHTIEGERLLERVGGLLGHIGRIVRSCHEHWDGGGYPDGLRGEQIPLVARIVMTCDAYSAMTTTRSYRAARTAAEACAELERCAGTQFDPRVVTAILAQEGEGVG